MKAKIKLSFCSPNVKPDCEVIIPIDKKKLIEIIEACLHHENSWFEVLVNEEND